MLIKILALGQYADKINFEIIYLKTIFLQSDTLTIMVYGKGDIIDFYMPWVFCF